MEGWPVPRSEKTVEEEWRRQLTVGTGIRWKRRLRNRIPSSPRCKMCAAPFAGPGAPFPSTSTDSNAKPFRSIP